LYSAESWGASANYVAVLHLAHALIGDKFEIIYGTMISHEGLLCHPTATDQGLWGMDMVLIRRQFEKMWDSCQFP
jgi:hypothetical protein